MMSKASDYTHAALVEKARTWLSKTRRCSVVLCELSTWANSEVPDAIGFTSRHSILVECKNSRADFCKDRRKDFRHNDKAMGDFRYYLCPAGLIKPEEISEPWGLVYVYQSFIRVVKQAIPCAPNYRAERSLLFSIARRAEEAGLMPQILGVQKEKQRQAMLIES